MVMLEVRERQEIELAPRRQNGRSKEFAVFCPGCKAFQTVWLSGTEFTPTRKFSQKGNQIYHDCGSNEPCRLYSVW